MSRRFGKFPRLAGTVTRDCIDRVNWAVEKRRLEDPRPCNQGTILMELIIEHLEPRPPETVTPKKKEPTAGGKRRLKPVSAA